MYVGDGLERRVRVLETLGTIKAALLPLALVVAEAPGVWPPRNTPGTSRVPEDACRLFSCLHAPACTLAGRPRLGSSVACVKGGILAARGICISERDSIWREAVDSGVRTMPPQLSCVLRVVEAGSTRTLEEASPLARRGSLALLLGIHWCF